MFHLTVNEQVSNRQLWLVRLLRAGLLLLLSLMTCGVAVPQCVASDPDFVDVAAVVPGLVIEMRYAGSHNFMGRPILGYDAPRCLLTRQAAKALAAVQVDVQRQGYGLKVFDCYRPARAVAAFVRWVRDPADPGDKRAFFPDLDKASLIARGYIGAHSAHSSGSTVDLTLRGSSGEVDMGTDFDFFGPRAWAGARGLSRAQEADRLRLRAAMVRHGFVPYRREWWHFTLAGEPYRGSAFDTPITP